MTVCYDSTNETGKLPKDESYRDSQKINQPNLKMQLIVSHKSSDRS